MGLFQGQLVRLAQRMPAAAQRGQNHQQSCLLEVCHQRANTLYRHEPHHVPMLLALQKDRHSVQEHLPVPTKPLHQIGHLALLAVPAQETSSQKEFHFEEKILPCPLQRGSLHPAGKISLLPLPPGPQKPQVPGPHPPSQEDSPLVLWHHPYPTEALLGRVDTLPHLGQAAPAQLKAVLGCRTLACLPLAAVALLAGMSPLQVSLVCQTAGQHQRQSLCPLCVPPSQTAPLALRGLPHPQDARSTAPHHSQPHPGARG